MLEERLGLQLPEVPQINIDFTNLDINALLQQISGTGCVPEDTQVSEAVQNAVQNCTAKAAASAMRPPTQSPRGRGNRGRNRWRGRRRGRRGRQRGRRNIINAMKNHAMRNGKRVVQQCVLKELALLDEGTLNQTAVNTLIDDMTAEESFKELKKSLVELCISVTPELGESSQRLAFQMQCIVQLNVLECMFGVADNISPTVGFVARMKKGKCLAMGLQPPARFVMAKTACISEEMSVMMRERLDETAPSMDAGGSRRRRDADMVAAVQGLGGLEGIERAIGAVGRDKPKCRPTLLKRCPKTPPVKPITPEELNRTLTRAEEVLGPLDEAFASVPERAYNATSCIHEALGTADEDGVVDVEEVQKLVAEFEGPEEVTSTLNSIVTACDEMGAASSVRNFTDCLNSGAAYACSIHEAMMEVMPSAG